MNTVILTQEQLNTVKKEWNKEYIGHCYEDGCLCGFFQCFVEEVGYLALRTHCRKSGYCPIGMDWIVEDDVKIFNDSLCSLGYVPVEDEDGIELLGILDKEQSKELKEVVRQSIIRDYTVWGTDEYGIDPNKPKCKICSKHIFYI